MTIPDEISGEKRGGGEQLSRDRYGILVGKIDIYVKEICWSVELIQSSKAV